MPVRCTLKLPQIELSYLEWNQGTDPLLLLHGLGDHSVVWLEVGDYFASQYHVVAPDMRGHGESGKPEVGYTFIEAIADLEGLMDHLGWSSAHVIGHSWTGKLVPIWATQNPQRLRSLILVDPFFIHRIPRWFKMFFPLLYRTLSFLKGMGPFPSYAAAEQTAKGLRQYSGWSPLQQKIFRAGMERKADGCWGSKFVVPARNQMFEDAMKVSGLTAPLDIPALFVKPDQGLNRMEWQLKPYHSYLRQVQFCEVPGNHWPFLVEPTAFNQAVGKFLAEQTLIP